ncbi:hypothetical protein BU16DRAFT_294995 [Lophium mytilinum]|uniref:Uncharacterized protein n=1 Tax=Lophium mytilinum TaxID=390894 RepID=A0A6A6R187_9PEZI|nr:hypothetical protein BU16DRAFT_294995 [Lophium mytilinum]
MSYQSPTSSPSQYQTYPDPTYQPRPYPHRPAFKVITPPDDTKDEPPPYPGPRPILSPQLPSRPYILVIPGVEVKRRKFLLALTAFLSILLIFVTGVMVGVLRLSNSPTPAPTPTTTMPLTPNITVTETVIAISTTLVHDPPPSIDPGSGSGLASSKNLGSGPAPTTLITQYTGSWVTSVVLQTVTAPVPLQTLTSLIVVTETPSPTLLLSLTPVEPMTAPLWATSTA